jgi:hypothetical protein
MAKDGAEPHVLIDCTGSNSARSPVCLVGDAAMGSPYFQSISLGFECAMFLAGLLGSTSINS